MDGPTPLRAETDVAWIPQLGVRFHVGVDWISVPLIVLTALLVFLCCLYSLRITPKIGRTRSLIALLLVIEAGVIGTFSAMDLVLFFLCFEIVLIPMWLIIDIWGDEHDRPGRRRAATTFVLMTVLGSAVMLLGFLLVYRQAGTFDLEQLAATPLHGFHGIPLAAAILIALGLAVKLPLWPLHIWLPDAHAKAPTVGSVLLAGVLLKLGSYGMIRILLPVLPDAMVTIAPYLAGLSTIAIVAGSLACLAQTDVKRLIAYSSVGHMGFIGLGIATLSPAGLRGALFANIAHGIITGLLFFLAGRDQGPARHQRPAGDRTSPVRPAAADRRVADVRVPGVARVARAGRVLGRDAGPAGRLPTGRFVASDNFSGDDGDRRSRHRTDRRVLPEAGPQPLPG